MVIDIISYTDAQYAALTAGQLQQVISAQKKKNALAREYPKKLAAKKAELIENGLLHSDLWKKVIADMREEYETELKELREGLLTYLRFAVKPSENESLSSGYDLDYSLSIEERYAQVKTYFETEYEDVNLRFLAFKNDQNAEKYLGELYATLYDYFYAQANA